MVARHRWSARVDRAGAGVLSTTSRSSCDPASDDHGGRYLANVPQSGQRHRHFQLGTDDIERLANARFAVGGEPVKMRWPSQAAVRAAPEGSRPANPRYW